jgi:hypothetical protein
MRVLKDFSLQGCRITLFQWNNRYLIKLEEGPFEQTFKVDQFVFNDAGEVEKLLDEAFISEALERFSAMAKSLRDALQRA